jgi:hypothetical protein
MVSVLASSAVDRGFEFRPSQTKDYKIGICCFSIKHATLRRKSKGWLARNQDNVSEWRDMSTRGLVFQWANTIQLNVLTHFRKWLWWIQKEINIERVSDCCLTPIQQFVFNKMMLCFRPSCTTGSLSLSLSLSLSIILLLNYYGFWVI